MNNFIIQQSSAREFWIPRTSRDQKTFTSKSHLKIPKKCSPWQPKSFHHHFIYRRLELSESFAIGSGPVYTWLFTYTHVSANFSPRFLFVLKQCRVRLVFFVTRFSICASLFRMTAELYCALGAFWFKDTLRSRRWCLKKCIVIVNSCVMSIELKYLKQRFEANEIAEFLWFTC